jgi:tripeptide aminopeptidase
MITIDQNRLIDIFIDLVAIDATSKKEKPVADYIKTFLAQLDVGAVEDDTGKKIDGTTGNIIAKIRPADSDDPITISFAAHMDTVKSTRGIKPLINNGTITSDGNTILGADNRAGIAMILYLVDNLKRNKIPHIPFEILFTVGEETGLYGSTHLDMKLVESRVCYILDSSADPGYLVYAAPGATDFEIEFHGKASHAAVNPRQGINALSMAAFLIHQFQVGQIDDDTTINFGKIHGGEANNVVPPQVKLTGEIRSFSKEKIEQHYKDLQIQLDAVESMFGGKCQLSSEVAFPGFVLDVDSEAIQKLINCMKAVGLEPRPIRYHGGSDANVLNSRGIAAIDLGIGAKNPHSTEEYIKIEDLLKIGRLIHHLVML